MRNLPEPKRNRKCSVAVRSGGDFSHEWNRLVSAAREKVLMISKARMDLADLALSACVLTHGGGGHWTQHEGKKTVISFARDIGINYKTLIEYIRLKKRIVSRLKPGSYDERNFAALCRTQISVQGIKEADLTDEKVQENYDYEKTRKLETHHIYQAIKYTACVKNKLKDNLLKVDKCKNTEVNELIFNCKEILKSIESQGYKSKMLDNYSFKE